MADVPPLSLPNAPLSSRSDVPPGAEHNIVAFSDKELDVEAKKEMVSQILQAHADEV